MLRNIAIVAFLAVALVLSTSHAGDNVGFKGGAKAFNGKNLKGWKTFLKDDKADAAAKDGKASDKKVRLAEIEIEGALPESPGEMSLFGDLGTDLRKTLARIEKAGDDDAISGIVIVIDSEIGRGKLNELRGAIKRVQTKGKKVYALLESAMGSSRA